MSRLRAPLLVLVAVIAAALACGQSSTEDAGQLPPTVTRNPTTVAAEPSATPQYAQPTTRPTATRAPSKAAATVTSVPATPTAVPAIIMYVCGIDRCHDSGEYGQLIYRTNIPVWNHPDPDRGGLNRQASHQQKVTVLQELRVNEGPGGLWYELADGGWINDLWLTEEPCTQANLEQYSFHDCLMGLYVAPTSRNPAPPAPTPTLPAAPASAAAGPPAGAKILKRGVWKCPDELTGAAYAGSKKSKVFHHLSCPSVNDIKASNRICYANRAAAVKYGKRPCKRCNP